MNPNYNPFPNNFEFNPNQNFCNFYPNVLAVNIKNFQNSFPNLHLNYPIISLSDLASYNSYIFHRFLIKINDFIF